MADTTKIDEISPGQRLTRRRAMGRRFIRQGSQLNLLYTDLMCSPDLDFLTDKERKQIDKLLGQVRTVASHFDRIGTGMDQP